jgi:hypothetical protein
MKSIAIALLALLASCAQTGDVKSSVSPAPQSPASVAPVNSTCPVSQREVNPDATATHGEHVVAFCCGNCKSQFSAWPASKKDEFVQASLGWTGDAINSTCPISSKAVDGSTVGTHAGHRIAFCCGNCQSKFEAWPAEKKDGYVKAVLAAQGGEKAAAEKKAEKKEWAGDPYLLTTCAVSGEALGSMGDAVSRRVEGREVKLCCKGCIDKLEADPAKFLAGVDAATAADQAKLYPTTKCLVSGEEMEGEPVDVVVKNRLFRVCCKRCAAKVKADPGAYAEKLDAMIVRTQSKGYPVTTCVVRPGDELDADAKELVVGNRLVKLCCKGCVKKFKADPAKYVAEIDRAWAAKK